MQFLYDWSPTKLQQLGSIGEAFAANPVLFGLIFGFGFLLLSLKWRAISRSQDNAVKGWTAGWDQDADTTTRKSAVGIGEEDVLVMRPANKPLRTGLLCLIFFGGGAVFFWLVPMQEATPTAKDWAVQVTFSLFGLLSFYVIWMANWRVVLSQSNIEARAWLRRTRVYPFASLQNVTPVHAWERGVVLHFNDGRKLRVNSMMSGYATLLDRLKTFDRKIPMLAKVIKQTRAARA